MVSEMLRAGTMAFKRLVSQPCPHLEKPIFLLKVVPCSIFSLYRWSLWTKKLQWNLEKYLFFFFFFQKNLRLHLFTLFKFKTNSSSTPHASGLSSIVTNRKRTYSALKLTQEHSYSLSHIHNTFTYSFIQQPSFWAHTISSL